jgi:uncharacterized protein (DUF1330 family)
MVGSTPPLPLSAAPNDSAVAKAYVIAEVEVRDAAAYEDYKSAVVPIVAQFGGRYIARGGQIESVEGSDPSGRVVIIEFPDFAAAQAFLRSEEYRPVADIRHRTAISRIMIVEGTLP